MKNASSIAVLGRSQAIGIDVCKAELCAVGRTAKGPYLWRVDNQRKRVEHFLRRLRDSGYRGRIICESTGHHHLLLVLVGHELGLDITVLNPLQSSKHSKARIRKTKSDPTDALTQADMGLTEPDLPAPARLSAAQVLMRLKQGQLASLEKQLQQSRQSLNQYEATYAQLGFELSDLQHCLRAQVAALKRLQQRLEQELADLLLAQRVDDAGVVRLSQIPGYSPVVCGLVGQLDRQVRDADAWVAYAGMDVSVRESGTWKGRGKLTKRGNAYLRKRLYQAAWGAYMHYDYVRAYYDDLRAHGRQHKEALNIIARKLLRIAYEMCVKEKNFDPDIAFACYRA